MGAFPDKTVAAQKIPFFKIYESGFDPVKDLWANQIAVENGHSYTIQIPSDIKSGTYVIRTELVALHGNMDNLKNGPLAGPQFYPYCFNVEVIGGGSATPAGVNFPGAYKLSDYGIAFSPYVGNGSGTERNAKYVSVLHLFPC
jgi:cellulase